MTNKLQPLRFKVPEKVSVGCAADYLILLVLHGICSLVMFVFLRFM